ncbi:MAG: hypothetical protein AABX52_02210 [Nanoarchaeota archaeon]
MKKLLIFSIILLLLLGCARPPSLKTKQTPRELISLNTSPNTTNTNLPEPNFTNVNTTAEIIANIENQTSEENEPTNKTDTVLLPIQNITTDRVDVHLIKSANGNKSEITAKFNLVTEIYTLLEIDKDAVIFEIAKRAGKPLKIVRYITFFDNVPYLRPSERKDATETIATKIDLTIRADQIPIFIEKEEGFIRGVGCSLEHNILHVVLHNDGETDFPIYRDVRPRIKGALVLTLNTRVLSGLYCNGKDILKAGGSLDCIKSNTIFVRNRQKIGINENATDAQKVKDMLVAYYPGYFEKIEFDCAPGNIVIQNPAPEPETTTLNMTLNITSNKTLNQTTTISNTKP